VQENKLVYFALYCITEYQSFSFNKAFSNFLVFYNREAKQKINKTSGIINIF